MVVVVFVLSVACVYVAVVLIVRHALQLVMPTATQTIATNMNKSLFIVHVVLVNKIGYLFLSERRHKDASFRVFRLRAGVDADATSSCYSA